MKDIRDLTDEKPTFENEKFRVWNTKEKDFIDDDEGLEVEHKGTKIKLLGFNVVMREDKMIFAYKIKDLNYLYFKSDDLDIGDEEKFQFLLKTIKEKLPFFNIKDMREQLEEVQKLDEFKDLLNDEEKEK